MPDPLWCTALRQKETDMSIKRTHVNRELQQDEYIASAWHLLTIMEHYIPKHLEDHRNQIVHELRVRVHDVEVNTNDFTTRLAAISGWLNEGLHHNVWPWTEAYEGDQSNAQ